MASIKERVIDIVAEEFGIDERLIDTQTELVSDLRVDSLDRLALVMRLEEEYRFSISDDFFQTIQTVGDVIAYVARNLKEQPRNLETIHAP